jgi:hypothetical protein
MQESILTSHEATIVTAQVQIHTLRVGKKQVTMGLFRQLPRLAVLDKDSKQLVQGAILWGHVNYWWDGDGSASSLAQQGKRRHVVWQSGDLLYRDIVYQQAPQFLLDRLESNVERARLNLFLSCLPLMAFKKGHLKLNEFNARVIYNGVELHIGLGHDVIKKINDYSYWRDMNIEVWAQQEVAKEHPNALQEHVAQLLSTRKEIGQMHKERAIRDMLAYLKSKELYDEDYFNLVDFQALLDAAIQTKEALEQEYARQWSLFEDLPQLFIAV